MYVCIYIHTHMCVHYNFIYIYNFPPILGRVDEESDILIKLSNIKYRGKIWKAAREKQQITYKGIPIRLTADLSAETLQARREWQDIFKVMKEKNLQQRLLYPARISFRFDREIKTTTDKEKLREFSTTKPALQQLLKELLLAGNTREGKELQ